MGVSRTSNESLGGLEAQGQALALGSTQLSRALAPSLVKALLLPRAAVRAP